MNDTHGSPRALAGIGASVACLLIIGLGVLLPYRDALIGDQCILSFDTRLPPFIPFSVDAPVDVTERPANLVTSDLNGWIVPETTLTKREVLAGRWPLWNPYVLCGQPLLANLALPLFYLPNLLHLLIDPLAAFAWVNLLHLFLAGVGTFLLLNRLGFARTSALAGGVATAMSSWLAVRLHLPMTLQTAAWFPLLLYGIDRFAQRPTWRWSGFLALVCGMAALAGFPQIFVLELIGGGVYFVLRWIEPGRRRGRMLAAATPALLLGLGLSAVQMGPSSLLYRDSIRIRTVDPALQSSRALLPAAWVGVVLPEFFGSAVEREAMPATLSDYLPHRLWLGDDLQENPVENAVWLGGVGLLFALIGLGASFRSRRTVALAVVVGIGLLLSVRSPWLATIHEWVPPLATGNPKRALLLVMLPLAILVGVGVEALLRGRPALWKGTSIVALTLGLSLGLLSLAARKGGVDTWLDLLLSPFVSTETLATLPRADVETFLSFTASIAAWRALPFVLAAIILGLSASHPRRRPVAIHLLLLVMMVELGHYSIRFNPLQERAGQYPTTPAIEFLRGSGERSARFHNPALAAALIGPMFPYRSIDGGEPMVLHRVAELLEAIEPGRFNRLDPRVAAAFDQPASFEHPIFLRMATPWIVTAEPLDLPGLELAYAGEAEGLGIYRQPRALPRYRFTSRYRVVRDAAARLEQLASSEIDPREVILEEAPQSDGDDWTSPLADGDGREVRVVQEIPGEIRLSFEPIDQPSLLVVTESFETGWRAMVDGVDAPLLRADHAFMAIPIPAGTKAVELRYRPTPFYVGLVVSVLSLVGLLFLFTRTTQLDDSVLAPKDDREGDDPDRTSRTIESVGN